MLALGTRDSCLLIVLFSGLFTSSALNLSTILCRISAAAAFVNVTTSSLSTDKGAFSSVTLLSTRSDKTAVLPEPAAADTKRSQSLVSIADCCSFVHTVISYFPFFLISAHASSLEISSSLLCLFPQEKSY